jgi:hypothetical protein
MAIKLIAVIACLILVLGLGVKSLLNTANQKSEKPKWEDRYSLKEFARRGKEQGQRTVTVPGPFVEYTGVNKTLDEARRTDDFIVGEVITSKSYYVDPDGIRTWYRFRIVEVLSENNSEVCDGCPYPLEPPQDFSLIGFNEFLLPINGGTISIDGVDVTVSNRSLPVLETGKKYLLVMSLSTSRVAMLRAGPSGVFRVSDDGKIESVNNLSRPMQSEIAQRYKRLTDLKSHLRH